MGHAPSTLTVNRREWNNLMSSFATCKRAFIKRWNILLKIASFFTDRVAIISITRRSILNYNRLSYNKYFRIFYNKRLRTVKLCYPLKAFAKNTLKWRILPREVSKKLTLKLLHFQHLEIYSLKWLFFLSRESFIAKFIPSNLFTETRRSFIANKQLKRILFFFKRRLNARNKSNGTI